METFIILFQDDEAFSEQRQRHMDAHLDFLVKHQRQIQAAGPLSDTSDQKPAGGLWVVHAKDRADVMSLVEQDPFWPTGLRKQVRILKWTQVFRDGKRLVSG